MEIINIGFNINNDSNSLISMSSTHEDYYLCGHLFIVEIMEDIENSLKDKEIAANLSTIGIDGVYNGEKVYDIQVDNKYFLRDDEAGLSLIARLAEKAIQVIRFNYDISEDEEIKVHVVTRSEIEHGLYFCFRFISGKLDITLDKDTRFPVMRKTAIDELLNPIADDINKCNIDLENQDLATTDEELHQKAMYAMGVPEDFINKQVGILKFEDENIKKSTNYKEYYSFKDVYDLLSDGYLVDGQLATRVFEKFEHEIDITACRIAMIEYLDSITPSNMIAKIGFKEVAGGDVFTIVSKLKDNNANINCEDYDTFEIVIKIKSPKRAELDSMDIRNQFTMKYPELKDDLVLTKKVDVQGNIASILETKLKYDAMFILTNNYVNKENMIMSTIKDKEVVGNTEKEDFDRAVHNVRNSIVTEIKK